MAFVPRLTLSCGEAGEDAEHVARFELAQAGHVTLELANTPFAAMAVRSDCEDPETDAMCGFFAEGFALEADLAAGPWFVVVKSSGGHHPRLTLTVE